MKWNDRNLPYSGENKQLIYNYLLITMRQLFNQFPTSKLTTAFIMNYILNDIEIKRVVFETKEKCNWFSNELKSNPFLFDFIVTETQKIKKLPNIYQNIEIDISNIEERKTKAFASVIQKFIIQNPELPHLYFSSLDIDEVKANTRDFVKKNYRCYKCKRSALEYKYENLLKVKILLERDLNIRTIFSDVKEKTLFLKDVNDEFEVNVFYWGDFPIVPIDPKKNMLFCIIDDISVRVFGIMEKRKIVENSNDGFLFFNKKPKSLTNFTALANFDKELFKKEVII